MNPKSRLEQSHMKHLTDGSKRRNFPLFLPGSSKVPLVFFARILKPISLRKNNSHFQVSKCFPNHKCCMRRAITFWIIDGYFIELSALIHPPFEALRCSKQWSFDDVLIFRGKVHFYNYFFFFFPLFPSPSMECNCSCVVRGRDEAPSSSCTL